MRKKLVAGNWKMHGGLTANAALLAGLLQADAERELFAIDVTVFAPYPYLSQTQGILQGSNVKWGAQNIAEKEQGAFTGEVSGSMLKEFGCSDVIVGHSERRSLFGESDEVVALKAAQALVCGLTPVVCLGETLEEREAGQTNNVVERQLNKVIDKIGSDQLKACVLAYEPVWAIGTGKSASPDQVQEVHELLRGRIIRLDRDCGREIRILYGGSVKASNAAELFALPDVDGALVGGASLVLADFLGICKAACN